MVLRKENVLPSSMPTLHADNTEHMPHDNSMVPHTARDVLAHGQQSSTVSMPSLHADNTDSISQVKHEYAFCLLAGQTKQSGHAVKAMQSVWGHKAE